MKSGILAAALFIGASAFALQAHAETTANEFVQKAAIAGQFEIESSKVALERSNDKEIKAFAQQMIDDHTKADKELKTEATKANITSPTALDEKHQKIIDELKTVKAEDFNDEYVDAQEDAHEDAVKLFENYSEKGDNPELKSFAAKTLPKLKDHHTKIEAIDDKEGKQAMNNMEEKAKDLGHDAKVKAQEIEKDVKDKMSK